MVKTGAGDFAVEKLTLVRTGFASPWREGIVRVRCEVFVEEQKVPVELELDEFDEGAVHVAAVVEGEVVGTLRMLTGEGYLKVGRVAVLAPFRRKGVGTAMMEDAIRYAKEVGAEKIVLDAQIQTIPFYEKLGFIAEGDTFYDAGILHKKMTKRLEA